MPDHTAVLLIKCPDKPGIIAAISTFLFGHGANITDLDQHSTDDEPGVYFMRLELQTAGLDISLNALRMEFSRLVGEPFWMEWRLAPSSMGPGGGPAHEMRQDRHDKVDNDPNDNDANDKVDNDPNDKVDNDPNDNDVNDDRGKR